MKSTAYMGEFSSAFNADPLCRGVKLLVFEGTDRSSPESLKAYDNLSNQPHWELQIDYGAGLRVLPWTLHVEDAADSKSESGDGDARTIAHATCAVITRQPNFIAQ